MRRSFALVIAIAITLSATAHAQRRDTAALEQDLAALRAEVAELRELAVQAGTNGAAVQELSQRLVVLEQQLDTLRREQASFPDVVAVIDQLTLDLDALEQEVGTLRTRLADLEQPSARGAGAGGGAVAYRDGFQLRTADGAYALRLTGYAQTRYQLEVVDGDLETSTFAMRRARIGARGHLGTEDFQYKILAELLEAPVLRDYYLDWRVHDRVWLRAGQDKVHFTRSFITSSVGLAFPERPAAIDALRYGRDVGLAAHGELAGERLAYWVGLSNGAGENRLNDNIDLLVAARVEAAVAGERIGYGFGDVTGSESPRLTVGAGLAHDLSAVPGELGGVPVQSDDVDADGDVDNIRVISASADAVFRYRGLELVAEGVLRREDWGSILDGNAAWIDLIGAEATRTHLGGYAQATYFVTPERILVGARVGATDLPALGVGGEDGADPTFDRVLEADALAEIFWRGARLVGLQYTLGSFQARDEDAGDLTTHRVIVEAQIYF
jgi:hypothetical protein